MEQYLNLLQDVLENGLKKDDRTGIGTLSVFGRQVRFDLSKGFPLLTTKKVFLKSIIHELLWFIKGDTNIRYLVQNDVKIWNEWPYQNYLETKGLTRNYQKYSDKWKQNMQKFIEKIKTDDVFAKKWGDLGPVYGKQWRNFNNQGIDQLSNIIETLKNDSNSRRILIIVSNPAQNNNMILPPCHSLFQFYVADGKLSCQLYQRSCDLFLGAPFDIASGALLTLLIAQVAGFKSGEFIHTFGDLHLYNNHIKQAKEQLTREPKILPEIKINPEIKNIEDFKFKDFELVNYNPYPLIKATIAI